MADLMGLAAKCEAAMGPDAKLDREILDALYPKWVGRWLLGPAKYRFTASLDAAMTLVPEGWGYVCRSCGHDEQGEHFARVYSADFASVTWGKGGSWITEKTAGEDAKSRAATLPLALCAAALKLRAAQ